MTEISYFIDQTPCLLTTSHILCGYWSRTAATWGRYY